MHANLLWARGIREQGRLNPVPYHPWTDWMQAFAPYQQWVEWWGGEQIFQQSPLYAYVLSIFVKKLALMRALQALMSIGTCVFLGLFTRAFAAASLAGLPFGWRLSMPRFTPTLGPFCAMGLPGSSPRRYCGLFQN